MSTRRFPGQRAARVTLRTAHIGAAGVALGAATLGVSPGVWPALALLTGLAMAVEELVRHGVDWFRYLQSWVILAKLLALALTARDPALGAVGMWIALALGSVIAHAPGAVRQYALWGEPGPCAARCDVERARV